jgi:hypothetical protein
MGVYSAIVHLATEIADSDYEEIIEKRNLEPFWSKCDLLSENLHKYLSANQEFSFYSQLDHYLNVLKETEKYVERARNFTLSNIGAMRNTNTSGIRIREHYVRQPSVSHRVGWSLFVSVSTVDGNLCIGFSHNELKNPTWFINDLIGEIDAIVKQIITEK